MSSLTRSAARSIAAAGRTPFALACVDPAAPSMVTAHSTAPHVCFVHLRIPRERREYSVFGVGQDLGIDRSLQ
jgi:hypothetical protein